MPGASGVECVRVLVSLGWMPASWTDTECHLENGTHTLTVPLEPALAATRLAELVDRAGLTPLAFVSALEKLRTARMRAG